MKEKTKTSKKQLGSDKAVETMYKNAYRTELDIIALATTKANIMISLNGFIISALMISGVFIFSSAPIFFIPANIFLVTASASMIFALLSASPNRSNSIKEILRRIKDFILRKITLKELKNSINKKEDNFSDADHNVLIYEDRALLGKDKYWKKMRNLIEDRESIYFRMSEQLYWLGDMASRQFKLLNMSYSIFRGGLIVTIVFVLFAMLYQNVTNFFSDEPTTQLSNALVSKVKGVYEPSGVTQLRDGRLLVVEDEPKHAFGILSFDKYGKLITNSPVNTKLTRDFKTKLNDLEGVTSDNHGYVYAITSHSKTDKGNLSKSRMKLLRFKIKENSADDVKVFKNLMISLNEDEKLQSSIKEKTGENVDFSNINIEGLEYYPKKKQLLLAFREPVINGKSMIIPIENPKGVFSKEKPPKFGKAIFLDLKGGGIRSIDYDQDDDSFIIANEIKNKNGKYKSQLWSWSGEENEYAKKMDLPEVLNLKNVEAVDSIMINGEKKLLLMSDNGNAKKHKYAKYILLDSEPDE